MNPATLNDDKINVVKIYQKGYADGYRRHQKHNEALKNAEYQYVLNVLLVVVIFILFVFLALYVFSSKTGAESHYQGDCLIDLATTYKTNGCLDN